MQIQDGEVSCPLCGNLRLNRTDMNCWRCGHRELDRSKLMDAVAMGYVEPAQRGKHALPREGCWVVPGPDFLADQRGMRGLRARVAAVTHSYSTDAPALILEKCNMEFPPNWSSPPAVWQHDFVCICP